MGKWQDNRARTQHTVHTRQVGRTVRQEDHARDNREHCPAGNIVACGRISLREGFRSNRLKSMPTHMLTHRSRALVTSLPCIVRRRSEAMQQAANKLVPRHGFQQRWLSYYVLQKGKFNRSTRKIVDAVIYVVVFLAIVLQRSTKEWWSSIPVVHGKRHC